MNKKQEGLLMMIWTLSLVATLGSLFYSEINGYTPCEFCWLQRIFMYPLILIYGTALLKKDIHIALPGFLMSGIGLCISIYHYSLQKLPALQGAGGFCGDVPCTLQYVNYFGFITIPFLAGLAFITIFVLHVFVIREGKQNEE